MLTLERCAALLLVLVASGFEAAAATPIVSVDIGRNGQAVEPGYTGFSTPGGPNDDFSPQAFPGGTWDIEATAEAFGALEGDTLVSLGYLTSTTGTDITSPTTLTVEFTTTSLVDGYVLRFDPFDAAGSFHFDFSGFELEGTTAPPVPALSSPAWLILAVSLAAGALLRLGQATRRSRPIDRCRL